MHSGFAKNIIIKTGQTSAEVFLWRTTALT
jgi:hypothetical protein